VLARVWIERNDLERAEKEAQLAVKADGDRVASLMTLARVKRAQDDPEGALAVLDQAFAAKKPASNVVGLHFLRGDVLARLGRAEEAERDFRREIELFPEDAPAYKNLILLLVAQGRVAEGTELIRQLVAASPTPPSYMAVCHVLDTLGDTQGVRYWARQGLARFPANRDLRRIAG
jgi:tetratricopeptide (TPR) repeat protein